MYFLSRCLHLGVSWIFETDHVPSQFHYLTPKTYNYTCFLNLISGTVPVLPKNNVSYKLVHLISYLLLINHEMTQASPSKQHLSLSLPFSIISFSPYLLPSSFTQIIPIACQVFPLPMISSYFNPIYIYDNSLSSWLPF